MCCIGVAHNYFAKRKYNLVELVRPEEETSSDLSKTTAEINSKIPEEMEGVEPSEVKAEDSENKVEGPSGIKVEGHSDIKVDTEDVTESNGTPEINWNGNCEEVNSEEKVTKDEKTC